MIFEGIWELQRQPGFVDTDPREQGRAESTMLGIAFLSRQKRDTSNTFSNRDKWKQTNKQKAAERLRSWAKIFAKQRAGRIVHGIWSFSRLFPRCEGDLDTDQFSKTETQLQIYSASKWKQTKQDKRQSSPISLSPRWPRGSDRTLRRARPPGLCHLTASTCLH